MNTVEKVLAALGIEVAEARKGRLWAKCPFHDDHDPSWFIRVTTERFGQNHCFSCEGGGTLLDLAMHAKKLGREEARAWVKSLGDEPVADPEPLPQAVTINVGSLSGRVFTMPREFLREPLAEWVTPARRYAESRGITALQVERWFLGYAVDGKLAGRIVIPTTSRTGFPQGYMARSFAEQRKRYLYPSAADRPNLDVMFGEFHWPAAFRRKEHEVVVTEGALNALAVERARPGNLAALGGRHIRPMHVGKLATFGLVTILTDPDDAGDAAAKEIEACVGRHTKTRRVRLPEDRDANDMTREELAKWLA